jgi:hypothetical protein
MGQASRTSRSFGYQGTQCLSIYQAAEGLIMLTNSQRIARCARAVAGYSDDCDPIANLVDLLADAMHLCRSRKHGFDNILVTATMHFEAECGEDAAGLPALFDRYEIHGVREFGKGKNRYCEQVRDDEAQFWSLYGHIPGQGLDCIGDFKTREHAEEVYARITGQCYGESASKEARHA